MLPPTHTHIGRLKQEDDCEFKTQLGYIVPGEP